MSQYTGDKVMTFWKLTRVVVIASRIGLVLCACALAALRWQIQSSLDECARIAQAVHPHHGDNVAAMLDYALAPSHSRRQRNRMIWALGQARGSRALPFLESARTDEPCDHAGGLCQQERAKAIKLCQGRTPNLLRLNVSSSTLEAE
jgi:hypothetical protein